MIPKHGCPRWLGLTAVMFVAIACGGSSVSRDAGSEDAAAGSDASIDPDGGVSPDAPDAGRPDAPPPFVCDPVHQSGCGTGEKCDIAANGTFGCVSDGTIDDFRSCEPTQPNDCKAGFTCRDTSFDDHRCARLCNPNEDQCRTDEPCTSQRMTSDGKPYRMCAPRNECNPLLDDCADATKHCSYFVVSICVTPGTVPDGGQCTVLTDCLAGSACMKTGPGETFRCLKMCNPMGGEPSCSDGVTCTRFATVGPQDVGACSLPVQ